MNRNKKLLNIHETLNFNEQHNMHTVLVYAHRTLDLNLKLEMLLYQIFDHLEHLKLDQLSLAPEFCSFSSAHRVFL